MGTFTNRVRRSWNAFFSRGDPERDPAYNPYYVTFYDRPDRHEGGTNTMRSVISAAYGRIAIDSSLMKLRHVRLNSDGKYESDINDELNKRLTLTPNKDQIARNLIRDIVVSMFDEGVVAVVPYEYDTDPTDTESFTILSMRVGKILSWRPDHILVRIYNDITGKKVDMWVEKRFCAIIENPFYQVVNEPNSVAQRLANTLNQIDRENARLTSGKLDLLVQLPYSLRTDLQKQQAKERSERIDKELENTKHGIAFIDATEKVIQLNRPIVNHLWEEAKDLKAELFSQLGFSDSILNGTADEQTMQNYQNQILEPILNEIVESMEVKWISKTARTQGQAIRYFREPFKLLPAGQLSDIVDVMIRNEVLASNDFRSVLGYKPINKPTAQEPHNPNMPEKEEVKEISEDAELVDEVIESTNKIQNGRIWKKDRR